MFLFYYRREVVDTATEYAVALGYRKPGETLSTGWFVHLKSRWPELKVLAPRGLELQRAKATSRECVNNYYNELQYILTKYNLCNCPERLYNVDEKGLSTRHKPPPVVCGQTNSQAVVSATRINVTVLGCGNAQGQQLPPYFVFPGIRMNSALLSECTPGADGTVSESGWSNSEIFKKYLQNHVIKYFPERSESFPVVLFYDGHRSHINLGLVQWARQEHIILFVLPAHTSHVLQPMDVGCFGPFEKIFNGLSHKFMRESCGRSITKFDIGHLACRAYCKALSPENLQSAFRKSGIFPLNPQAVNQSYFLPATALEQENCKSQPSIQPGFEPLTEPETAPCIQPVDAAVISQTGMSPTTFFQNKETPLTCKKPTTKKRKYLSTIVSGKAITEDKMFEAIQEHEASRKRPSKVKSKKSTSSSKLSPLPSTSGIQRQTEIHTDDDDDDDVADDEKCCVCNKFTPDEIRNSTSLIFTKWVQCDKCGHWTHLKYCTNVVVVRRGDQFFCKHCTTEE